MTPETEGVKARFGAHPNRCARAAMTTDARIVTAPIDKVVMALNAVHAAMSVVRETQDQRRITPQERFAQSHNRTTTHQS